MIYKNPTFSNITNTDGAYTDEDTATSIMQYYEGWYDDVDTTGPAVPDITDDGTLIYSLSFAHNEHLTEDLENIYMEPESIIMLKLQTNATECREQISILYKEYL